MKKIIMILALPAIIMAQGCSGWVDEVSTSPNSPTEVTPDLLLSVSEVAMQTLYTGQLTRTASILTQQCAGNDFQMIDIRDYKITELSNTNEWKTVYADALINQQTLIDIAGDENPYYRGIARVLKCMTIGIATDFWGDVPYSQALQGLDGTDAALNPEYDAQADIIAAMQSELDAAIADLSMPSTSNAFLPASDDFIHNGDVSMWIKAAHMMKARYANRLSKRDATGSANEALMHIAESGVTSNADNTNAIFGTNGNELNPWFSFNTTRANYIKMGAFFIDLLSSTNDPRLPLYATTDDGGGYSGVATNSVDPAASNTGELYSSDASPLPLLTYYEMKFIEAEANLRLGNNDAAAAALNDAVKANILATVGAPDPVYEAAHASETGASITLDKIMTQKYIAMFTQPESWADWRRTNIPALTPNPDAIYDEIPRRFPTCIDERLYNSNVQVVGDITLPVWWDE
ncbi:MAG TPA: SusD/RagB family nutrient-binding outer membrane lipoprotein [Chitinophagales bacterium]|nr:SusD/RagB family nutrient-binding outer membrane lipoprotein [Chitinophagales bacterium]HMX05132.1 SusD/RagB family nutrient-binding outer membrane lipoprotein [Chitinophagales bacterium]HMZ87958.1 SusD/RagB family nutrient-binding outer membrane lipoprotein [Chitinophagales bacterium]HNA57846.1 SusD/RagB family nutrient-binding outer membrane lipoprotein [Chitinophagales bacterium]HNE44765.1 SusD/RagB family nutrient-binding outer membrane lipoprotein [Chitinophagales bacterium]